MHGKKMKNWYFFTVPDKFTVAIYDKLWIKK